MKDPDRLERKLAHAHGMLEASMTKLRRTVTSITRWQRRVKGAQMAIHLRDHPEQRRPKREKPKTRQIRLPKED